MAKRYDTAEFRQIACTLLESSENVSLQVNRPLRWILDDIPEHLSGNSADALEETVDDLHQMFSNCSQELHDIGALLKQYASLLEHADKKAVDMIQSR